MRKIISIILCACLMAGLLSACQTTNTTKTTAGETSATDEAAAGTSAEDTTESTATEATTSLTIVATIFPEYDWIREILGETDANLVLLTENGVDLHSFQPTVADILAISTCDLFVYVGGESDAWVEDALAEATNEDMIVLNLLDILGDAVVEEEIVEGMEAEEEEEDSDEDEEEPEYDEHVWLSLKHAQVICSAITDALCELDAANADAYATNNEVYQAQLAELDQQYTDVCANATQTTLLFGDRFPFRYLVDDYGLSYYAAFVGCSAESEASFETIVFLAEKVDELGLSYVLTIETSDGKIAETIVENTTEKNQQILVLNSMQAVDATDIANGVTYLSLAKENLEILTLLLAN